MSVEHNLYRFCFKEVYTGKQKYYGFEPDISIEKFIEEAVLSAQLEFNLCHDEDFEIIEAGQFDNINGRDAELAPALEPSRNITIRQKYEHNYKNTAFYIRRIPRVIY